MQGNPGLDAAHEIGRDEAMREMERNLRAARLNLERLRLWSELWATIEKEGLGVAAPQSAIIVSGVSTSRTEEQPQELRGYSG